MALIVSPILGSLDLLFPYLRRRRAGFNPLTRDHDQALKDLTMLEEGGIVRPILHQLRWKLTRKVAARLPSLSIR